MSLLLEQFLTMLGYSALAVFDGWLLWKVARFDVDERRRLK